LREMKMVNLIRQAESGVVGVVKKAPWPTNCRRPRPMFKAIHGQTLQNNNCQILTKLEIDIKVLGLKWDAMEIQVCKDLL
jgi:hypothetical protein